MKAIRANTIAPQGERKNRWKALRVLCKFGGRGLMIPVVRSTGVVSSFTGSKPLEVLDITSMFLSNEKKINKKQQQQIENNLTKHHGGGLARKCMMIN